MRAQSCYFVRLFVLLCATLCDFSCYFVRLCATFRATLCDFVRTQSVRAHARMRTHKKSHEVAGKVAQSRTNTLKVARKVAQSSTKSDEKSHKVARRRTKGRTYARTCAHTHTRMCALVRACSTFGLSPKTCTKVKKKNSCTMLDIKYIVSYLEKL